jgi:hypothetical protein
MIQISRLPNKVSKPTVEPNNTMGGGVRATLLNWLDSAGNGSTKVPLLNVLWAHVVESKTVVVSVLILNKTKWALKHIQGQLLSGEETVAAAEKWTASLMDLAYAGKWRGQYRGKRYPRGFVRIKEKP